MKSKGLRMMAGGKNEINQDAIALAHCVWGIDDLFLCATISEFSLSGGLPTTRATVSSDR